MSEPVDDETDPIEAIRKGITDTFARVGTLSARDVREHLYLANVCAALGAARRALDSYEALKSGLDPADT